MTRFARARGSKASNERAPEDSTPWEVMKEQLVQAKKDSEDSENRKQAEQKRIENYENFLKEQKVQKRKATWCDFPESMEKKNTLLESTETPKKKKIKNKTSIVSDGPKHINQEVSVVDKEENTYQNTVKKLKNKSKQDTKPQGETQTSVIVKSVPSKKRNKKKKQQLQSNEGVQNSHLNKKESSAEQHDQRNDNNDKVQKNKEPKTKKNKKLFEGKPVRRKEINDCSFKLIINGKDIELVRFDGFPVMKKDAERLEELKRSMFKKGIPKSEVQRTIKLERRRAEKALARVKRDVCYNCRKGGHVLSDCPDLKSKIPGTDGADGVCFKCGSTEHRQFECKVQRDKEFRFATCFICQEPGHIARQCPDNPKGLYPNGGSCKLCGDVTHLRKDCPTVMDKKEECTVKLQTLDSGENIEDVGQQSYKFTPTETSKKPKKIRF